ncbi:MAG: polysaccharide biosynthesis tyrosine autokinase [Vicingaceae bacterium]
MGNEELNIQEENEREISSIKNALNRYAKKWPWFLIGVIVLFALAFLLLRFKPNVYQVETTVKVKGNNQPTDPNDLLFGRAYRMPFGKNHDEAMVMQSFPLIKSTVEKLKLNVTYKQESSLGSREIYLQKPFELNYDLQNQLENYSYSFKVECLSSETFKLSINDEEVEGEYGFGQRISFNGSNFSLYKDESALELQDRTYYIHLTSPAQATYQYKNLIEVEESETMSSLITLKMSSSVPEKAKDFLNTLIEEYVVQSLAEKNEVADNTIDFIDNQLKLISDSLNSREASLENFKSTSEISDVSIEAQMLMDRYNEIETQKAQHQVMEEYYEYLRKNLKKNEEEELQKLVAPSAFGIDDDVINQLVAELINLNLSKQSMLNQGNDQNPLVDQIDKRMQDVVKAIRESIEELSQANEIILANLNKRSNKLSESAKKLPSSERQLVSLNRLLQLNENIYLFLMEKRSNAAIQRSSNTPDCKIIEPARLSRLAPVAPNRRLTYMISILLGLFIPGIILVLRDFLNDTIRTKDELSSSTNIPILGTLPQAKVNGNKLVIKERPKSAISESFRLLRANLSFFQHNQFPYVVLISSSVPKEGKTFTAINLASVMAASGKKTVLLGFDLRKPQIHNYLNVENGKGLSNYLSGNAEINEIVNSSELDNLYYITSGPNPPNPSELIMVERTEALIAKLKEEFDYIIIDSPPVGLVTDALILKKWADLTLFICRQDYTKREFIANLNEIYRKDEKKNISLIYNFSSRKKGYAYGYYEEDKNQKWPSLKKDT